MAVDGLWGPCGIRLGSTGVGKVGHDSPRFAAGEQRRKFPEARVVSR